MKVAVVDILPVSTSPLRVAIFARTNEEARRVLDAAEMHLDADDIEWVRGTDIEAVNLDLQDPDGGVTQYSYCKPDALVDRFYGVKGDVVVEGYRVVSDAIYGEGVGNR